MASVSSLSFSVPSQYPDRRAIVSSTRTLPTNSQGFRLRTSLSCHCVGIRASVSSRLAIHCMSTSIVGYLVKLVNFSARRDRQEDMWRAVKEDCEFVIAELPTVSETKLNFLKSYKRPIPAVYNNVIQELIVQQHLMKYKRTYRYDPVFALGFVTVYDQLMDGYPSDEDRDAIFQAYIKALKEDPEQYRIDAQKLEEWARAQTASSLVEFASREGEVEGILKDIAERAGGKGSFSYSRFFAVGLFRLLELANATEPKILEKLCASLNVNKRSVDRDLDVYRNLLSKLVQAKELLKEYMDREKKKREERAGVPQANEAITKCLGEYQHAGL